MTDSLPDKKIGFAENRVQGFFGYMASHKTPRAKSARAPIHLHNFGCAIHSLRFSGSMKRFLLLIGLSVLISTALKINAQTNLLSVKLDATTQNLLREATKDKWLETWLFTVLGGILAAGAGILQSWHSHRQATRQRNLDDKEFADNILRAIRRELESLQSIYNKGIGARLEQLPGGQFFPYRLGLTQEWFTVFNSNAIHLGRIEGETSRRIVAVYITMKWLIEEYRINNDYLSRLEQAEIESRLRPGDNLISGRLPFIQQIMVSQAGRIRETDQRLKGAVVELFARLDQRGIK